MFAAQYCVTPTKRPGMRLPDRAATFLRDVRRRSLRVKRSKSLVINPKNEKRKSGKIFFVYYIHQLDYFEASISSIHIVFKNRIKVIYVLIAIGNSTAV